MPMPKATMHKDDLTVSWQNDIGNAGKIFQRWIALEAMNLRVFRVNRPDFACKAKLNALFNNAAGFLAAKDSN